MKKLLAFAAATIAASFASMSAHAVVLDFVAEAAGNERGITNGSTINNFQGTGVNVTFTAGGGAFFPYFDDVSSGKPAGLGVCQNLDVNDQCDPPSDDNVTVTESITVAFGGAAFAIRDITFYNVSHDSLGLGGADGMVSISLDGGMAMVMLFSEAIAAANANMFAAASSITFAYVDTEFYIGALSDVPLPGAIPLLLSGLAGLGFASRRRKKAA